MGFPARPLFSILSAEGGIRFSTPALRQQLHVCSTRRNLRTRLAHTWIHTSRCSGNWPVAAKPLTGVNLDIGHFTAAGYDAAPFIKEHHAKITNLHIKDRKKDHGPNTPWGQGDTPLKEVLQLLKKEKYGFPANIELECPIPQGSTIIAEMKKRLAYTRDSLA